MIQVAYKKQKTFASRLYKRERKKYYNNLDTHNITDNDDIISSNQVNNLLIDGKIVNKDDEMALNNFIPNAVKSLDIQENRYFLTGNENIDDPIDAALKKFKLHPSILKIKVIVKCDNLAFNEVTFQEIEQELSNLDTKKSTTLNNIPPKPKVLWS